MGVLKSSNLRKVDVGDIASGESIQIFICQQVRLSPVGITVLYAVAVKMSFVRHFVKTNTQHIRTIEFNNGQQVLFVVHSYLRRLDIFVENLGAIYFLGKRTCAES